MKLRLYSETVGMPVLVEYYDSPLAYVRDVLIDPETGKAIAFLLPRKQIVSAIDVIDWGQGLVIHDESHITPLDEVLRAKVIYDQKIPILGQKVITEQKEYIGRVHDVSFDAAAFTLHQLFVSRGFFIIRWFTTLIPASNIVKITRHHIIVKSDASRKKEKVPSATFETA